MSRTLHNVRSDFLGTEIKCWSRDAGAKGEGLCRIVTKVRNSEIAIFKEARCFGDVRFSGAIDNRLVAI